MPQVQKPTGEESADQSAGPEGSGLVQRGGGPGRGRGVRGRGLSARRSRSPGLKAAKGDESLSLDDKST